MALYLRTGGKVGSKSGTLGLVDLTDAQAVGREVINHQWRKPETGYMKVNIDAAFYKTTMSGAIGVVGRDDCGKFGVLFPLECHIEQKAPEEVANITGDILFLARHMDVKFQYVPRVSNNVAHEVAHWDMAD
ncbi:hypothetical protein LIER_42548 [Lithospermum erythrorhizon]|uniref:RNase H type-1 domain-containing protein n=1 Tax=Lithospermum erythrorhizon TaxID=34254 RepID=A0AAV3NIG7_LITER